MTTATTVLGLLPLSFGTGTGGEIQASLARVVIGGLTASTIITLVFIPVVYVAANLGMQRVKVWIASLRSQPSAESAIATESGRRKRIDKRTNPVRIPSKTVILAGCGFFLP